MTRRSWEHLPWVAEFAASHGAKLLQLHSLELAGRAEESLAGDAPDDDLLARVFLAGLALAEAYRGRMRIQSDSFHQEHLRRHPEAVYATDLDPADLARPAAELLNLIVIEADGSAVPVSYGFSKIFRICNVNDESLAAAWPRYAQSGYREFRRLCRGVFDEIMEPSALPFFNWYELMVARSGVGVSQARM